MFGFDKDIVVIDFETDMVMHDFHTPCIIQVGAVRLDKDTLRRKGYYSSLVRPSCGKAGLLDRTTAPDGTPLDPTLSAILEEDLDNARFWRDMQREFMAFCDGCMPAAWPTVFEQSVVKTQCTLYGTRDCYTLSRRWLDVASVCYGALGARGIFREGSAHAIAPQLGLPVDEFKPHHALYDAEFEAELLIAALCSIANQPYTPPSYWASENGIWTNRPWYGLVPADHLGYAA